MGCIEVDTFITRPDAAPGSAAPHASEERRAASHSGSECADEAQIASQRIDDRLYWLS
jgi:hypothetical protein